MISSTLSGPITFAKTTPLANTNIFVINTAIAKIIVPLKRVCLIPSIIHPLSCPYEYIMTKINLCWYNNGRIKAAEKAVFFLKKTPFRL